MRRFLKGICKVVQPSRLTYLVIQALARVIQNQLKKDGIISAIIEEDPMGRLRKYIDFEKAAVPVEKRMKQ